MPQSPPPNNGAARSLDAASHNARTDATDGNAALVVGTEDLLAVLTLDPGSRARRILNDLEVDIAAIKRELKCYVTLNPGRRRRHGGKLRSYFACSFCGRPASEAGHLVAGPGVWICASCNRLAVDVISAST